MVAADEMDSMWVAKLEADEEGNRFHREEASVDIITWRGISWLHGICVIVSLGWRLCTVFSCRELTQKQVVGIRTESSDLKDLYHIKELAMYISNNCDWRRDMYNVTLLHK